MTLSGRTISRMLNATSKNNKTPGRDKGPSCTKSALKTFGVNANPYKLHGDKLKKYFDYCSLTNSMNK